MYRNRIFLLLLIFVLPVVANANVRLELNYTPGKLITDETVTVSGLSPERATVNIWAIRKHPYSDSKVLWSRGIFRKRNGATEIQTSTDRPIDGSTYRVRSSQGLNWSMEESESNSLIESIRMDYPIFAERLSTDIAALVASSNDDTIFYTYVCPPRESNCASEELIRESMQRGLGNVTSLPAQDIPVVGQNGVQFKQWNLGDADLFFRVQLFYPATGPVKTTAVVVVPGSGGGLPTDKAAYFAARGYPSLAVEYFDYSFASKYNFSITQLPLEGFQNVILWLKSQSAVNVEKVVLNGRSRGGEAVLLVAQEFPGLVDGVIAEVPSLYSWGDRANGIWSQYISLQPDVSRETASWTRSGSEVPFLPMDGWLQTKSTETELEGIPYYVYRAAYENAPEQVDRRVRSAATIRVGEIRVPILVTGGGQDGLWQSNVFARRIRAIREEAIPDVAPRDRYLIQREAGHLWWFDEPTVLNLSFLFPSGVYDFAKEDFSNICAESDLENFVRSIRPVANPQPTPIAEQYGFPYQGHRDGILALCAAGVYLDYYLAPEFAGNGGSKVANALSGLEARARELSFLEEISQ